MPNRRQSPHSTPAIGLGLALAAAIALLWSCSSDSEPAKAAAPATTTVPDRTPETAEPTTTTAPPTPEQTVKAAYLAIIDRDFRRLEAPSLDDPAIAADHADVNMQTIVAELTSMIGNGFRANFPAGEPPVPTVQATVVAGERATLTVCLIDNTQIIETASG